MELRKIDCWEHDPILEEHPLLVSSVDWNHTELVDCIRIPLGSNYVVGLADSDYRDFIKLSVWSREEQKETSRTLTIEGLGDYTKTEYETHIEILGSVVESISDRPIRVKNLDDGSQYVLVKPEHLTIIEIEGSILTTEEQVQLYKVREGLAKDLTGLELTGCSFPFSLKGVDLSSSSFNGVDFSGVDFEGANLRGVRFVGCYFRGSNLKCADFSGALLQDVDFTGSNLEEAVFEEATLHAPIMKDCILTGVRLYRADFNGGDFTGSACEGVDFTGIHYSFESSESECFCGSLQDPRLIFDSASLRDAKFDGLSLSHAQFEGADLTEASFIGCDLHSEKVVSGEYCSEGTNFKKATLKGAYFKDANLKGVVGLNNFFFRLFLGIKA